MAQLNPGGYSWSSPKNPLTVQGLFGKAASSTPAAAPLPKSNAGSTSPNVASSTASNPFLKGPTYIPTVEEAKATSTKPMTFADTAPKKGEDVYAREMGKAPAVSKPKAAASAKKMATIWDPNTKGSKRTIEIGAAMPKGFKLWTGGNASEEKARATIYRKDSMNWAPDASRTTADADKSRREFSAAELRKGFNQ